MLAVVAVAVLVVGYLFLRSRGATPAVASPSSSNASPGTIPQTSSDAQQASDQQASADVLGALAGENQQLMKSFLASANGLVSLAGSSFGSFGASTNAGEPVSAASGFSTTSAPFDASAAAASDPGTLPPTDQIAAVLTAPTAGPLGVSIPASADFAFAAAHAPAAPVALPLAATSSSTPGSPFGTNLPGPSDYAFITANTPAEPVSLDPNAWGNYTFPITQAPSVTVTQSKPGSGNLAA